MAMPARTTTATATAAMFVTSMVVAAVTEALSAADTDVVVAALEFDAAFPDAVAASDARCAATLAGDVA